SQLLVRSAMVVRNSLSSGLSLVVSFFSIGFWALTSAGANGASRPRASATIRVRTIAFSFVTCVSFRRNGRRNDTQMSLHSRRGGNNPPLAAARRATCDGCSDERAARCAARRFSNPLSRRSYSNGEDQHGDRLLPQPLRRLGRLRLRDGQG